MGGVKCTYSAPEPYESPMCISHVLITPPRVICSSLKGMYMEEEDINDGWSQN